MAWLFERTVEAAAWVALLVAWISLGLAIYWFYLFVWDWRLGPEYELLRDAGKAAAAFVGFSLALGGLACVDRFLFDADETLTK
ncbi:hypothetical protein Pla108_11010 [Botrimarina colliarenosi]|uniref:Uncharacterized protein n=1 Tax=Botrimarina colliarenosi TaxID=2528001 RepID=A0A5C6AM08_9BACT|nr:hypothetical protein [Botrimarina colliarenosi]TWU00156.1 hypothetical protein Pla108_11010 [Botrimarina colliarenosi]